jgi:hypothetical protein
MKIFESVYLYVNGLDRPRYVIDLLAILPQSQIIALFSLASMVFFIRRKDKLLGSFIFPTDRLAIRFLLIDTSANRLYEEENSLC